MQSFLKRLFPARHINTPAITDNELASISSHADIINHLQSHYWPELDATILPSAPAVRELYERLDETAIALGAEAAAPELASIKNANMRSAAIIKALTLRVEGGSKMTGLSAAVPPDHIHRMEKKDPLWCGSFYQANMVLDALGRAGLRLEEDGTYLDFGCSSGSMVRVLNSLQPDASWHGCDPVQSSIDWATENLSDIDFFCNPQEPPMPCAAEVFDGVMAISIWSHFSERAALAWFNEMNRIIKSGGWLFFTSHGITTFRWQCEMKRRKPEGIWSTYRDFAAHNFAFHPIVETMGIDLSDWGNAYFNAQWVATNLDQDWKTISFLPGRNQRNQDAWLLRRR